MCLSSDEAELRHFPQMLQEWSVAPVSALCCTDRHTAELHSEVMLRLHIIFNLTAHARHIMFTSW